MKDISRTSALEQLDIERGVCIPFPKYSPESAEVLANRPDIIREDYMNELCILQDDVPAFPNQEARNIEDSLENFKDDPTVKIPKVYRQLSGSRVLVMEWIDGIRCTNPQAIRDEGTMIILMVL
ncbi:hypothetical protein RND71_042594 [Anisodus tanguticus]|uniref:ABC1 atypical kinase-like domain-containing protein n=1 Tax=Anisodus tanguticus TaxID=243964 RepID=A0AAE1UPA1_9SOLA|nr:hypothetical protein RND71_042594 [Anisodus tanguticus]